MMESKKRKRIEFQNVDTSSIHGTNNTLISSSTLVTSATDTTHDSSISNSDSDNNHTTTIINPNTLQLSKQERRAKAKALKKQKRLASIHVPTGISTIVTPGIASYHPFDVEPRDHAETPFEAYADIEPLLFKIAQCLGKTKDNVILYDPYYCEGSMRIHLNKLGFKNIINENKDFYETIKTNTVPDHDILITNPPFSSDHMERILKFCVTNKRPFFLLLPQFVGKKSYYLELLKILPNSMENTTNTDGLSTSLSTTTKPLVKKSFTPCKPIYIGPNTKAYTFTAPQRDHTGTEKLMALSSSTTTTISNNTNTNGKIYESKLPFQIFSGSFQCVWFIFLGIEYQTEIVKWWNKKYSTVSRCALEENDIFKLPQLMAVPKPTPAKRRWRKKISRLHKQMGKAAINNNNGEQFHSHGVSQNPNNHNNGNNQDNKCNKFVPGLFKRPGTK